jgi:hypothetical protein
MAYFLLSNFEIRKHLNLLYQQVLRIPFRAFIRSHSTFALSPSLFDQFNQCKMRLTTTIIFVAYILQFILASKLLFHFF